MSWSYNKEKPWLSGIMKRNTQQWVMLKSVKGHNLYYTGRGWSPRRFDAKMLDDTERGFLAQNKEDGHWFELVYG